MANMANTAAYRLSDGRYAVDVDSTKTLTAADCGYVQNVIAAAGVITVPATATLGAWTVRNGGARVTNGPVGTGANGMLVEVDCNASDTFQGMNVSGTAADGKKLVNTAATARVGDEVSISNVGATDGPIIRDWKGVWTRES